MPGNNKNVITFPNGSWAFFSYLEDGVDVIESWYEGQSFEAQLAFDKMLKQNVKISDHLQWVGYRHRLKGKDLKGGFELEFSADGRANRVLCTFMGPKRMIMLCGCYHKANIWSPPGALDKTARRLKKVRNETAEFVVKKIEDDF